MKRQKTRYLITCLFLSSMLVSASGVSQLKQEDLHVCQIESQEDEVSIETTELNRAKKFNLQTPLKLKVRNRGNRNKTILVYAWIGGEHRQGYLGKIDKFRATKDSQFKVDIPLHVLELPRNKMDYSGQIYLSFKEENSQGNQHALKKPYPGHWPSLIAYPALKTFSA